MSNERRWSWWLGCLLSTALLLLLLYAESQIPHSPLMRKIGQLGIILLCFGSVIWWIRRHPDVCLEQYYRPSWRQDRALEQEPGGPTANEAAGDGGLNPDAGAVE